MTTIVTILTDRYADWECALTMAASRTYYGLEVLTAAPGGKPVTSAGGLNVTPDLAIEDLSPAEFDILLINGGGIWETEDAPSLSGLLYNTHAANKPIGAICAGTLALAKAGLLDEVAHTSNAADFLASVPAYKGAHHYMETAAAVSAGGIVTAAGTAPVSFMKEVMQLLGKGGPELDWYIGQHAAEHQLAA